LLWVGQAVYRKGLHDLLDAVHALDGQVRLTLATRALPEHWAQRLGPHVDVELGADNNRVRELYATHDVFVLPSLVEGFGLVYLEAMAAGLPVVGTPHTGLPDVITEGREGRVVPAGDPEALTTAFAALAADPESVRAMGAAALRTARELTWGRFRESLRAAVAALETTAG
jgi:glycosyltransferase involved in cell wall biosynthesis